MRIRFVFVVATCLSFFMAPAQQKQIDSLRHVAEKATGEAAKIEAFSTIAEQAIKFNPDSCLHYVHKALALAKSSGEERMLIRAEFPLALYYFRIGNLDSSYLIVQKNIPRIIHTKDQLLVNYYSLEGNYFMRSNNQKEALESFYKALTISDAIKDPLGKAKSYNNIGFALMELNQYEKAIVEFKNAVAVMISNNINNFATVYNNIASCYGSLSQLDSAKKYVETGIEVARKTSDLTSEANGLNILGTIYQFKNNYKEALAIYLSAKEIREKIGDPFFIVSDLSTIADLYAKTGEYEKGIAVSKQALDIAAKNNLTAKLPLIYQSMASNYEASGNYREAANIYRKINALKDSLYADASPQALAEMQTKYETEKKENKIREQEYNLAQQKNRIRYKNTLLYGIIALSALAGLLGFTQYKRYKWKQEAKLRAAVLKQQEDATKAVIEAEEAERQRIAKDLHDGVGQMMSAARMNLSAFEHQSLKTVEDKAAFEKIISLVDDSCREVRAVSHNMMPNALLKNSLASAIREFIDKLDNRKLRVHLYTAGLDERLDANTETVLYRVIQECVNNVIKHAQADTLDISLIKEKNEITATVEDNGKGFDAAHPGASEGIGLKNIRTRIEYLKGTVDFDSKAGKGTLVAIHVPL